MGDDENPGPITVQALDERYVSKEVCAVRLKHIHEKLDENQDAIKGINKKISATLVFVIVTLVAFIVAVARGLL